ncbi:MAG: hypothetical protein RLZZ393_588 [Pseudomonadota bacterium]|jgi:hypothetical protein
MTPATSTPFSDAAALAKLAASGDDLTQLHRIEFTLHFPSQFRADEAVLKLEALAFATTVARDARGGGWQVVGVKKMYPVESDLLGLRDKLDVIATEGKGSYDGWRASPAR